MMFSVVHPSIDAIRHIQSHEKAFYWSLCAEAVLRRYGIVNVTSGPASHGAALGAMRIVTRGQDLSPGPLPQVVEGPLTPTTLANFSLKATDVTTQALQIRTGTLEYPTCRVRKIPLKSTDVSHPYAHKNKDVRWNNRTIHYQIFKDVPQGWEPILHDNEKRPIALRKDNSVVFGIPIFDLMAAGCAFAPLDAGYYDMISNWSGKYVEAACIAAIRDLAIAQNIPLVEVEWWPYGKTSAFSIRQDMDRPIEDATMSELLAFYESRGVKASFGVLNNKISDFQIGEIKAKGHEINLHTVSRSLSQLREEKNKLEKQTGVELKGFHSHGGGGSEGFLGGWHHRWGEEAGFDYLEMAGRSACQPSYSVIIHDDLPKISHCVMPGNHYSIDAGMKPEAHHLEFLMNELPSYLATRAHFVLMNHPDIHLAQVYQLIEAMDLDKFWCATLAESCDWFSATRGAQFSGNSLHFNKSLPHPCVIQVTKGQLTHSFTAEKGIRDLAVKSL